MGSCFSTLHCDCGCDYSFTPYQSAPTPSESASTPFKSPPVTFARTPPSPTPSATSTETRWMSDEASISSSQRTYNHILESSTITIREGMEPVDEAPASEPPHISGFSIARAMHTPNVEGTSSSTPYESSSNTRSAPDPAPIPSFGSTRAMHTTSVKSKPNFTPGENSFDAGPALEPPHIPSYSSTASTRAMHTTSIKSNPSSTPSESFPNAVSHEVHLPMFYSLKVEPSTTPRSNGSPPSSHNASTSQFERFEDSGSPSTLRGRAREGNLGDRETEEKESEVYQAEENQRAVCQSSGVC